MNSYRQRNQTFRELSYKSRDFIAPGRFERIKTDRRRKKNPLTEQKDVRQGWATFAKYFLFIKVAQTGELQQNCQKYCELKKNAIFWPL